MKRYLYLTAATATLAWLAGCGDARDVKLGVEGETCLADSDCRDDLLCVQRQCAPLSANNGGDNNGSGFTATCDGVCDHIAACGVNEPNCESECDSETRAWTPDGRQRVFDCLLDLQCDEIGQSEFYNECKALRFGGGAGFCQRGFEGCVCDEPEDVDPEGETCHRVDNNGEWQNNGVNNVGPVNNGEWNNGEWQNNGEWNNGTGVSYRYLLLEDLSPETAGRSQGADVDAIAIDKGGVEFYATVVEDFNTGGAGNEFTNPEEALGAPDSGCTVANFFAMGGSINDGYLMVSFGTAAEDVTIDNGDALVVYELGPTVCPNQSNWVADEVLVSISTGDDRGSFFEQGVVTVGQNVIPVWAP